VEINDLIHWWENEINSKTRNGLMGDYTWTGPVEDRHQKLREFREKWEKSQSSRTKT
jgi:3'-phosphoadenosine 5'-phosphosulfate sulfotransferase (PAPS reductase)/FAD synthetase